MSKASTLICDHPADTLYRCADVAEFLRHAIVPPEGRIETDAVFNSAAARGLDWIMEAVRGALQYEAERYGDPGMNVAEAIVKQPTLAERMRNHAQRKRDMMQILKEQEKKLRTERAQTKRNGKGDAR